MIRSSSVSGSPRVDHAVAEQLAGEVRHRSGRLVVTAPRVLLDGSVGGEHRAAHPSAGHHGNHARRVGLGDVKQAVWAGVGMSIDHRPLDRAALAGRRAEVGAAGGPWRARGLLRCRRCGSGGAASEARGLAEQASGVAAGHQVHLAVGEAGPSQLRDCLPRVTARGAGGEQQPLRAELGHEPVEALVRGEVHRVQVQVGMPVQQRSQTAQLAVADPAHHDRQVGVAGGERGQLAPVDLRPVDQHRQPSGFEQLPGGIEGVQGEVVRARVEGDRRGTGVSGGLDLGAHPGQRGAHVGGQRPAEPPVVLAAPLGQLCGELFVAAFAVVQLRGHRTGQATGDPESRQVLQRGGADRTGQPAGEHVCVPERGQGLLSHSAPPPSRCPRTAGRPRRQRPGSAPARSHPGGARRPTRPG